MRAAGFAVDVPMGVPESRVARGQKIALHGGDEFEGVLNKMESRGQGAINASGYNIDFGTSYIQVVTFDERRTTVTADQAMIEANTMRGVLPKISSTAF